MKTKEKRKMIIIIVTAILTLFIIYTKNIPSKETYATDIEIQGKSELKISNAQNIDLEKIIKDNTKQDSNKEEIYEKTEELEYITKYRKSDELYVGTTQVAQEGKNGIQTITMKKKYDKEGKFIGEEQVSCVVTKSSINKIIEIGTKIPIEEPSQSTNSNTRRGIII